MSAQAKHMADGIDKIGAVQRIEMKFRDAMFRQIQDLFGGDGCGGKPARLLIVFQALEAANDPVGMLTQDFAAMCAISRKL